MLAGEFLMIDKKYDAVVTMDIKASREATWDALTKPELVKQYMHGTTITTNWKVGSPITWRGIWKEKSYEDKGEVLGYVPSKLLRYTYWSPMLGSEDKPENYHIITIELLEDNGLTKLTLAQSNNPSQEAADAMAKNGWLPMMQSLKSLVEK